MKGHFALFLISVVIVAGFYLVGHSREKRLSAAHREIVPGRTRSQVELILQRNHLDIESVTSSSIYLTIDTYYNGYTFDIYFNDEGIVIDKTVLDSGPTFL